MAADGEELEKGEGTRERVEHLPGLLTLYSDGSFERLSDMDQPASVLFQEGVASRDVVINASAGIWVRIFLPLSAMQSPKAPIVLHFHGGGFCVGSPASPNTHDYCTLMARRSACIWISVNYRLAPEHPLPAAYEDAYASLVWLHAQAKGVEASKEKNSIQASNEENDIACSCWGHVEQKGYGGDMAGKDPCPGHDIESKEHNGEENDTSNDQACGEVDPWLAQYANFSSCFITGDSAGGTTVHYVAAQAAGKEWSPLHMKGLLLIHPAFPMEEPQGSNELTRTRMDFYHKSVSPPGAPFGHVLMNPLHSESPIKLSHIKLPPVLVAVAEKDPLRSGDLAYFHALLDSGHNAQLFETQGVGHCFHTKPNKPLKEAEMLENVMIHFIRKHAASPSPALSSSTVE